MRKGFIHCHIYHRKEDAFLIEDGKFVKFASSEEIERELDSKEEIVDIHGMSVYPGFIDSHMHLLRTGEYLNHVALRGVKDAETVRKKVEAFLDTEEEWITGRGYACDLNKQFLDSISTTKAIALQRVDGHSMVVNSKALEKAHITCDTDVEGGHVDFDSGMVYENAIFLIKNAQPEVSEETIEKDLLKGMQYCASFGITALGSDDFVSITKDYKPVLNVYEKLRYQKRMPLRVVQQCEFETSKDFAEFLDEGYTTGVGDDFFCIGPLKLIGDGSLGSHNAAMIHGYKDDPDNHGQLVYTEDNMEMLVQMANSFNMPTIVHAIGDKAVEEVLDVFEKTLYEGNPLRSGLVHCQILNAKQLERIKKMHLSCYIQSLFIEDDASMCKKMISKPLLSTSYPFRALLESVPTSNGSDSPVCTPDPLLGISLAVSRKDSHGIALNPKEAMSVEQALDTYTAQGAYNLCMEDRIGKLQEGYYADFVVLEKEMEQLDPQEIPDIRVMMTVVNGTAVYER